MIECPACKAAIRGMDLYEGRVFHVAGRLWNQHAEGICPGCGAAVQVVRVFDLDAQVAIARRGADEVAATTERLGLIEPRREDLSGV
jgi:hypothetical protein